NALVLKQLITMFRALHTFTTDSDPRDVVTQGAAIEQAAGATSGFVGGLVGAKAAEKGMHHASAKFGPKQPPHPRPPAARGDGPPSTPPAAPGRPASPHEAGTHPAPPAPASTGGAAAAPMPEHATPPKHLDAATAIEVTAVPEHAAIGPAKPSPGATPEAAPAAHEPAS